MGLAALSRPAGAAFAWRMAIDHAAVHRAPAPAPHSRLAAEAHGMNPLIHDEAALPHPQIEKRNPRPLRFALVRVGFVHHSEVS